MTRTDLKGLSEAEMEDWAVDHGLGAYRGRQIRHWVLTRFVKSFDEMDNLPKTLRALLKERTDISPLREIETVLSEDGTRKYLHRLHDHRRLQNIPCARHHIRLADSALCSIGRTLLRYHPG